MKTKTLTGWLKKQEKLCDAATSGPWKRGIGNECGMIFDGHYNFIATTGPQNGGFIASSRLALPMALKIIRCLESGVRNHGDVRIVMERVEKIINEAGHEN